MNEGVAVQAIKVLVHAHDSVSLSGTLAILRRVPQVRPFTEDDGEPRCPDVVVLVTEGFANAAAYATLRRLHERYPRQAPPRCVLIADSFLPEDTLAAVECGVFAFISRSEVTSPSLVSAVLAVGRGNAFLSGHLQGRLMSQLTMLRRHVLEPKGITLFGLGVRERAVLKLLSEGHGTDEIARRLRCSEGTVKNVLYRFMARQGLNSRSQAVAHALRVGAI
ncbi:LuxR C-terminal-related transcriptional regulator [Amycolatopsis sp. cg5]|uniref:helix-turn-helix transcriptional regulator n=1 Tax=Amycolatopsis sp. cg5 TaxID=3238802 RepID=UPI003525BA7F